MSTEGEKSGAEVGLERIVFFSDAVMAIAITLLALDIRLPEGAAHRDSAALRDALVAITPRYFAYVLTFLVIGQFWNAHHLRFRYIRRFDSALIWLNLLFLMVIGFMPFASSVLSADPNRTAHVFYNGTMAAAALLSALIWAYAITNDRLVDPGLDRRIRRNSLVAPLAVAAVFALAGVTAAFDVHLARWCWLLLVPAALAHPERRMGRRAKRG